MVEYLENGDLALYNGYKFRKDKRTGYYLSSRIINGKRRRLHVYIYGNVKMVRFQMDILYIIKMRIKAITKFQI